MTRFRKDSGDFDTPEAFAESLKQRRRAARGLSDDLVTKVPLLYGSPETLAPHGDPGILLTKAHQDDLLRKHGGGVLSNRRKRADVALPFERTLEILLVLLFLFFWLSK